MSKTLSPIKPVIAPPLDAHFRPAVLFFDAFHRLVEESDQGIPLILGFERPDGSSSRFETHIFAENHPLASSNLFFVERLVKTLLWQRGACKVFIGGPAPLGQTIRELYSRGGARWFDAHFLGEFVYERPFEVISCTPSKVPAAVEKERSLGRHLEGCRIGFDLGASDLKVSAVVNGEVIFSQEIIWEPRTQDDLDYHYQKIMGALSLASAKMPCLDAVGGSAAGIYMDNRPMVASLFRGIPRGKYDQVHNLFLRIREELGVPLEVVNDGEVTALAGSMSLGENCVLGIAMGSSEAGGYITSKGNITNWLNELAFVPVDLNPAAPADEWSGDPGCGSQYFSQQCVFRLAPAAGIVIPPQPTDAARLEYIQHLLEEGHPGARRIWETMGVYLGYGVAGYASFYDIHHVLVLGRCTSGLGGNLILESARQVLKAEFPSLAQSLAIHLPDEKTRRIGQSIAAASLPALHQNLQRLNPPP